MKRAVSLILILSLILAIFAIPAQASAVGTGIIITASAASVISAALIGLGVLPGTDGSVFDGIVSGAADYLSSLGFGDGVGFPVLKYLGTGGVVRYALESAAMIALRSWLFDEDVVSPAPVVVNNLPSEFIWSDGYGNYYFFPASFLVCYPSSSSTGYSGFFVVPSDSSYNLILHSASTGSSFSVSGFNLSYNDSFYVGYTASSIVNSNFAVGSSPTGDIYAFMRSVIDYGSSGGFSSSYDVTLGDVASPNTSLSDAYPGWGFDSIQIDPDDGDDPIPYVPIGLDDRYDGITQEDVQSGESTLETPNEGTEVTISGDVGGSLTPDGGGSGDLPSGDGSVTVDDLTTMFAWLAVRIDEAVESLFPDLQVIKTYLKAISQWHETENVKYDSMLSYFSGWDADIDTMLSSISNIDLNITTLVDHAATASDTLAAIAADVQDIRDVVADPLDADINEQEQDNKNAFLNTFSKKSQADNIGDLSGLSDGFTEWFSLDVDPGLLFDQVDTGFGRWFTSETAQSISVGGGAAAAGIGVGLMDDVEYVEPETPYLDAYTQEVQDILAGGDGEW